MDEESHRSGSLSAKEVRRRFVLFLSPGVLQAVLAFVTLPLTTMELGPADFALFAVGTSFTALIASLALLGSMFVLGQRFGVADEESRRVLVTTVAGVVLSSSVVLTTVMVVSVWAAQGYWQTAADLTPAMLALLATEAVGSTILALSGSVATFGYGAGYYVIISALRIFGSAVALLVALFAFRFHVLSLFIGNATGGVVALVGSFLMLSKFFACRLDRSIMGECFRLGGWTSVGQLTVQAKMIIERTFLASYAGLEQLGIYTHAQQFQGLALLGSRPIQTAIMPTMLEEARAEGGQFDRTLRATNVLSLSLVLFGVTLAFFGLYIIGLLTHGKFDAAAPYAALLTATIMIQCTGRPQYARLITFGGGKYLALSHFASALASIAIFLAFLPFFGIAAALVATFAQQFAFRVLTGVHRSAQSAPFQDALAVQGVVAIICSVAFVQWVNPTFAVRTGGWSVVAACILALNRRTVFDAIMQVREQIMAWK